MVLEVATGEGCVGALQDAKLHAERLGSSYQGRMGAGLQLQGQGLAAIRLNMVAIE